MIEYLLSLDDAKELGELSEHGCWPELSTYCCGYKYWKFNIRITDTSELIVLQSP